MLGLNEDAEDTDDAQPQVLGCLSPEAFVHQQEVCLEVYCKRDGLGYAKIQGVLEYDDNLRTSDCASLDPPLCQRD